MFTIRFEYLSRFVHTTRRYVKEHNHGCYELVYYLDGQGETCVNQETVYPYGPGTYMIYNPYDLHTETHSTDSTVYCLGFYLTQDSVFHPQTGIYRDENQSVWRLIDKIFEEIGEKRDLYPVAARLYTCELLLIHHRRYGAFAPSYDSMNYIYRFLEENFSNDICLKTLVDMSGYSYDYFRHLFKESFGVSPKNYILDKRITYGKQLLKEKSIPVSEIAHLCGFSTVSQFNSIFKKRVGVSPLQFKKNSAVLPEKVVNLAGKEDERE